MNHPNAKCADALTQARLCRMDGALKLARACVMAARDGRRMAILVGTWAQS